MLHQVDFKDFLRCCGAETVTDIWGESHRAEDVDVILTKSMFKGCGWLRDSGMTWADYWGTFRRYRHVLYITNVSKEQPQTHTDLNYQFLNTASIRADEFRPRDLPDGWTHSPEEDDRSWLTKETELAYYNFRANETFRRNYFLQALERRSLFSRRRSRDQLLAALLKKNHRLLAEPVYRDVLDGKSKQILKDYSLGRLIVAGDNRYLSGDLLDFMARLLPPQDRRQRTFYLSAMTNGLPEYGKTERILFKRRWEIL